MTVETVVEVYPIPQTTRMSGEHCRPLSSPAGSGAEPPAETMSGRFIRNVCAILDVFQCILD